MNYSTVFFRDGGELGEMTRQYDWTNSILGPVYTWPQSLKTTVSLILSSKFPMFLWWGEHHIQFYNDAYRHMLGKIGKHPLALGQRGADCWPEIWPVIKPLIDQVIYHGKSVWKEDELIPIERNGKIENVYWTFSYSPVLDDRAHIQGVLVVCQDTTKNNIAVKEPY